MKVSNIPALRHTLADVARVWGASHTHHVRCIEIRACVRDLDDSQANVKLAEQALSNALSRYLKEIAR